MINKQQTQASEELASEEEELESLKKLSKAVKRRVKIPTTHLSRKKININCIIINVSETQYSVVSDVAEDLQWRIQTKADSPNWDVYWLDSAIPPQILFRMNFFQKINHYPGIHIIARKNLLGLNLMAMREKFQQQYNFFPLTWMLPSQFSDFRHYFQSGGKVRKRIYIVKPEADCQGRGIFLTKNIEELANGNHYVVQKYINKPFLIQGLKFDFRIYVLLAGTEPLRVYVYKEGLARFATEMYKEPNNENMDNMCMHLTNYAVNKNNPKFIFNTSEKDMGVGHKRSLSSVYKLLQKLGHNVPLLKSKINDIIVKTFITGLPLISHQYRYSQPEEYYGNMCFHILGFDIMINNELEPYLLEVNHTPSFTTDTPLDHYIKYNLIKDTLILVNVNSKTKAELYNKAKECNSERLYAGKRRIYQGIEKQQEILKAQVERDEYEKQNMGGFVKIHPIEDQQLTKKYKMLIEYSHKIYTEDHTFRGRIFKEEEKKMKAEYDNFKAKKGITQRRVWKDETQIAMKVQTEEQKKVQLQIQNFALTKIQKSLQIRQLTENINKDKILVNQKSHKLLRNHESVKQDQKYKEVIESVLTEVTPKVIKQPETILEDSNLNFIRTKQRLNINLFPNEDKLPFKVQKLNKRPNKISLIRQKRVTSINVDIPFTVFTVQQEKTKGYQSEKQKLFFKDKQKQTEKEKSKSVKITKQNIRENRSKYGNFLTPKIYDVNHQCIFRNKKIGDQLESSKYNQIKKRKLQFRNRNREEFLEENSQTKIQ